MFETKIAKNRCTQAALCALLLVGGGAPAYAQPAAEDRSAIEEKKKAREEAEKRKAEATVNETGEQKEERERGEKKAERAKEAVKKYMAAGEATRRRENQKALDLMEAAWMLDPYRYEFSRDTAALAEALQATEMEFRARVALKIVATKTMAQLADTNPKKKDLEDMLAKSQERLDIVKGKLSTGVIKLSSEPKTCEIFLEGTFVGIGSGEIEAVAGQRKVEAHCQGFYDHELFVNVRLGDPSSATIKPNAIAYFGELIVKVEPQDGVTIFLDDISTTDRAAEKPTPDGKITGKGTRELPYKLAARKWIIRFQKDGYDRWHRRIEVKRDQKMMIDARLEALNESIEEKAPTGPTKAPPPAPPKGK